MGWGSSIAKAYQAATDTAKAAASKAAQTAQSAYDYVENKGRQAVNAAEAGYDYTKQKAGEAYDYGKQKAAEGYAYGKQKAEEAYQYGKQKAVEAYDYGKEKAGEARDWAKDRTRDAERGVADSVFDGYAAAGQGLGKAKAAVGNAYDKGRALLGMQPAGSPTQACPHAQRVADKATMSKELDGWIMVPQGPGKDCIAVPPGQGAVAKARAQATMSQSACCKAKGTGGPPRDIVYVNGIMTDHSTHCDALNKIAEQTCGRVIGVYNATEGFVSDGAQTGQDRRLIKAAASGKPTPGSDGRNPAVDTLARAIADETEQGRPPEVWAHSQGGAVTSLALYEAKNDLMVTTGKANPLAGMTVKSFGSAAPQWPDGPSYEHFVHMNDPVPTMFGLGHDPVGDAANGGAGAKVIRFAGDVKSAQPFDTAVLKKEWLPTNINENHSVHQSYLRMEKQVNGGCP